MDVRAVFEGYEEGPLLFRPTYKYDVGTDDYDTGEKHRIPAWTGTIIFVHSSLDILNEYVQTAYYTGEKT